MIEWLYSPPKSVRPSIVVFQERGTSAIIVQMVRVASSSFRILWVVAAVEERAMNRGIPQSESGDMLR